MRNTLGNILTLTLFGESHGPYVGVTLDGLRAGIKINHDEIKELLAKRRPQGKTETQRIERDQYQIISGEFNGYTTGQPLTIIIPNENVRSNDYEKTAYLARPSHADYVAHIKYNGYEDYRGGGHFSGRLTVGIVVVGGIILQALKAKGINIYTHILECGKILDHDLNEEFIDLNELTNKSYPVINDIEDKITKEIENIRMQNDSIGGIIQTAISGLPAGLGEPWFSSMESEIAKAVFAIGGIKGIEFGKGFKFKDMVGSIANDQIQNINGKVSSLTNNNGGILGGITNGMPIIFNCAVKPTPSISKPQHTINVNTLENDTLTINGRHDPAIIRRICIVITCITALVIADEMMIKEGTKAF